MIVDFQDLSTGNPTSWTWDFGNGATSNIKNPSTNYFTVFAKPAVSFNVSDSIGCFPVYSLFVNTSTAAPGTVNNAYFWDFGDGIQSTLQNPGHSYTTAGNFTVTLKVTNDKGCWS